MTGLLELYRLAEEQNILVDCFELQKREALSLMDSDGRCYVAIDPFQLRSEAEEKEKLAHELGHCITGSFYNRFATCDVRQKHENRADKWAIQTLIPRDALDSAVAGGCTDLWSLAEHFSVTEELMRKAVCWYTYGNLNADLYF